MPDGLTLTALTAGYGVQTVLHGIDLKVPEGTLTALIGPNGHGKSTLLRAISGLVPNCTGSIAMEGTGIDTKPAHKRALSGLVHIPQGDLLFGEMSVEDNLLAGALRRKSAEVTPALTEVFDLFPKLAERRKQSAASLSGGERRMVGIGRGLMQGGTVLMIDEPSLGLAPAVIEQIYGALAQIKAGGRTILLVEENPMRIVGLADDVALMDDGRIVWSGDTQEMQKNKSLIEAYLGGVAA